jgi:hypothetical protein
MVEEVILRDQLSINIKKIKSISSKKFKLFLFTLHSVLLFARVPSNARYFLLINMFM